MHKEIELIYRELQIIKEEFIHIFKQDEIEKIEKELKELEYMTTLPNFWDNHEVAMDTVKLINQKKKKLNILNGIKNDINILENLLKDDESISIKNELINSFKDLKEKFNSIKIYQFFDFKYDKNDAILEIHTGMGGEDASDFSAILLRMYILYAQKKGFEVLILDKHTDNAGIKKASIKILGEYAYGIFKHEKGVHRLIRLSPFKSNDSRQTSFSLVEVLPILKTENIEIKPSDLKIDFFCAGGPGGQNVNKVETAVRITHIPTNIVVSCQTERSQSRNREIAMQMLYSKLMKENIEKEEQEIKKLKGDFKQIDMGSQIRTYTLHPYKQVKDHRSNYETTDVDYVFNGNLDEIINSLIVK